MKKLSAFLLILLSFLNAKADICEAQFSYSVDGYIINLDGSPSVGDITSWSWYINGDLFSDAGPETHITVEEPGEYLICLVIETASGCVDTFCHGVVVEEPQGDCEACFTYWTDGLTINLNGGCSTGDVTHWLWYINGDLFNDAGPETHITVEEPGEYQICLVIETASGCVDTFCHGVVVEEPQGDCEACFTYWTDGFTINLNGACSAGDVTHWLWYINGDLFSDAGPETHITVEEPDEYQICLVIETAGGCADTFCSQINIEDLQEKEYNFSVIPSSGNESLVLKISSPTAGSMEVLLSDISGRKIFDQSTNLVAGVSQYTIVFGKQLSPGILFITVKFSEGTMMTQKLPLMK